MSKIKEVTVFTKGDSSKISTWSNVPYFFTETLLSRGVIVNRVDLSPIPFLRIIFNRTFYSVEKKINKHSTYDYFRSLTHFTNSRYRIKKAINQYPNSDANIFLTFSFSSAGLTQKPAIQFSDWTYDHYFKYFEERKPDLFEKQCVKRENSQIEGSDIVVSLFPSVAKYMKEKYINKNIYHIGHAINTLLDVSEVDGLKKKINSNNILFVGSKKYIEGAKSLINAFKRLQNNYPELSLHIIGMDTSDFENLPEKVYCYGYLDKGNDADRKLYYSLFKKAKMFINTTPKWAAFSATIEAMYFYIPVITSPYVDFVETFGSNINFGYYCERNTASLIEKNIAKILTHTSYESLCTNAHNSVKNYTWNACMDKLIGKVEDKLAVTNTASTHRLT